MTLRRPLWSLLLAATVALASSEAHADEGLALRSGFELGGRAGYGFAFGSVANRVKVDDLGESKFFLMLDLGYRITPELYVGVLGEFGALRQSSRFKDGCSDPDTDCGLSNLRLGVNAQYHLESASFTLLRSPFIPWFGAGLGYEELFVSQRGVSSRFRGGFLSMQLGFDVLVSSGLHAGPMAELSFGRHSSLHVEGDSQTISEHGVHSWLMLGVRAAYTF